MEPPTLTKSIYLLTMVKNLYSQNNSYFLVVFTPTYDLEMHEGWDGWVKFVLLLECYLLTELQACLTPVNAPHIPQELPWP